MKADSKRVGLYELMNIHFGFSSIGLILFIANAISASKVKIFTSSIFKEITLINQ